LEAEAGVVNQPLVLLQLIRTWEVMLVELLGPLLVPLVVLRGRLLVQLVPLGPERVQEVEKKGLLLKFPLEQVLVIRLLWAVRNNRHRDQAKLREEKIVPIHAANLVIGNTVIDLSNTTVEQVFHDRNPPANSDPRSPLDLEANVAWSMPRSMRSRPKLIPTSAVAKLSTVVPVNPTLRAYLQHRRTSSYISDMVTANAPKGFEKRKSSYVSKFLQEDK